ncbi:MAG TPA: PstS family phosphate ABC transporter substrate-binding protein [Actinomycetota bacterium]|nr:PstS family phosphate ABC transporter substrate-binding protein [Actinomycetota bacterium]
MRRRSTLLVVAGLAFALLGVACGGGAETGGGGRLSGQIAADGSSTVFPITQAVAEEFNRENPDVRVSVGTSGTGGGFEKFCNGETDISDASRPIDPEEEAACRQNGIEYVELQVAVDGLSVMVNPQNNFVECLTVDELKKIWEPDSNVKTWNQIRPGFPNQPIALYGPGTDSGTFDYFTDEIVGEEGASRSNYTASEDDNVLVQGIAGDANALGYFGYAYFTQNTDKLKAVAIDDGNGCVAPNEQTITSGQYSPLSRPLFIYVKKQSASRPEVRAFVDFFLQVGNELNREVGYIPVPQQTLAAERAEWQSFKA